MVCDIIKKSFVANGSKFFFLHALKFIRINSCNRVSRQIITMTTIIITIIESKPETVIFPHSGAD
jgi:hypothetical protein